MMYKSPQTDVKEYLFDDYNLNIYKILTGDKFWKTQFKPLSFFNLLYAELEFFERNANDYVEILRHFGNIKLKDNKRYFLFTAIKELIEQNYQPDLLVFEPIFRHSFEYIKKMQSVAEEEVGLADDETLAEATNEFNFGLAKAHLNGIAKLTDKIKYLKEVIVLFKQREINWNNNTPFIKNCLLEIQLYKDFMELEKTQNILPGSDFKLHEKKGNRIDFIRIINALYHLNLIEKQNGDFPTKGDFMKNIGNFFGIDLSNYDADLSQAFSSGKLEPNLLVFDKMKEITQKQILDKLNN